MRTKKNNAILSKLMRRINIFMFAFSILLFYFDLSSFHLFHSELNCSLSEWSNGKRKRTLFNARTFVRMVPQGLISFLGFKYGSGFYNYTFEYQLQRMNNDLNYENSQLQIIFLQVNQSIKNIIFFCSSVCHCQLLFSFLASNAWNNNGLSHIHHGHFELSHIIFVESFSLSIIEDQNLDFEYFILIKTLHLRDVVGCLVIFSLIFSKIYT